ncbi:MAG: hypothetical protein U1F58_00985 [Burkholderiales bacterium]
MLSRNAARMFALLVPRVRAAWPAIGAIALAVVLAHSGVAHLDPARGLDAHYGAIFGGGGFARPIGILQLFAAGGLAFRRTRVATATALGAVVVLALANQLRTDRLGGASVPLLLLFAWAIVVAWGERRRARDTRGLL